MSQSKENERIDLFKRFPLLKTFVKKRWFQFALIFPTLIGFYIILLAGFIGTPVGNKNLAIVIIWIFWWFLLIAILVPFGSRIWCTICPLPFFGELTQRWTLIKVKPGKTGPLRNKLYGLNLKWPKFLKNIWVQNIGFLLLCTFSAMLVTRPIVTAVALGSLIILAIVFALIYRLRAFCSYVCPVGGFLSLYSMTATIELRSKSEEVCKQCKDKSCIRGNDEAYGCPWYEYIGNMKRNNYCGLCMECVKACSNDNIALNLRPFATETKMKGLDESWKGFIMLALAMAYSVILQGTNGTIKDWANVTETGMWKGFFIYVAILWGTALLVLPSVFFGFSYLTKVFTKSKLKVKEIFLRFSYVIVPIGLLAWIAFSVPLIFVNGSYIIAVISDPFGWGWDVFGTADFHWQPLIPEYLVYIQITLLFTGLYFALKGAYGISLELFESRSLAIKGLIPIAIFSVAIILGFLKFFIG